VIDRVEFHLLQIEHDVGHVFDDVRQRLEFVIGPGDPHRGNGGAFNGTEQHPAKRIADSVSVTGFKRLGDEFGVSISARRFVFDERLGHFETT
jgi:hypothetical protein